MGRRERKIGASLGWQHPSGLLRRWNMVPQQRDQTSAKADKSRGKRRSMGFVFLPFNVSLILQLNFQR